MKKQPAFAPDHIGFILDGNRRWAKLQGIPQLEGHRKGYENLKTIAKASFDAGAKVVSAYVFSTENWNRSAEEVSYLMKLLRWVCRHETKLMHEQNIRVRFVGSRQGLSTSILRAIDDAEALTAKNTAGVLALCLNYGGKQEVIDAVQSLAREGVDCTTLTEAQIASHLYAPDLPPLDLVIRTSGEQRLSNFMLWRVAYSELYFSPVYWPAFSVNNLQEALDWYAERQRRFGK